MFLVKVPPKLRQMKYLLVILCSKLILEIVNDLDVAKLKTFPVDLKKIK